MFGNPLVYRSIQYYDEYENEMDHIHQLLGTFGISTISGIAYEANFELIILGISE